MQILGGGRATLKLWASSRQRGPEVLFGEIAIDLLQARFWITSGWPTIQTIGG
jgi:hypothetical protein